MKKKEGGATTWTRQKRERERQHDTAISYWSRERVRKSVAWLERAERSAHTPRVYGEVCRKSLSCDRYSDTKGKWAWDCLLSYAQIYPYKIRLITIRNHMIETLPFPSLSLSHPRMMRGKTLMRGKTILKIFYENNDAFIDRYLLYYYK